METNTKQSTILTLHNLLGVNRKIDDQVMRVKYLREVWGLDQKTIAECEETSQTNISKLLQESKFMIPVGRLSTIIEYKPEEIEMIQRLPRSIIQDVPLIAFVNNILELNPNHTFYYGYAANINLRIAALSSIGIQNRHLQNIFGRSQPNISMIIKRNIQKSLEVERPQRYDLGIPLKFSSLPVSYVWRDLK